ncbi:MAG: GlcG/HbpS family heme-binding protein [Thermodesulfobacteriota bacterium]
MFKRDLVGLREAQLALEAIFEAASKNPEQPISVAIVDSHGELICTARMDGAIPMFNYMALKKARTSALLGMDTRAWGEFLQKRGYTTHDFFPDATGVPGGVAIIRPGEITSNKRPGEIEAFGGIGVSGRTGNEDEELAKIGFTALQKAVWG